ncbi:universal stress protein [Streptomyces sp. C10-9-1]|uniref:universal stress protein n=1 Tax=Streptomyces sp. C10-9-1 TaxID=1859285 RepID=UPI002112938E|nr:universal stress protein [Streptomyces sp. C10-9-1]MCQ6553310.1 universal stress protein [Streptomyces sp. C10-9-1]
MGEDGSQAGGGPGGRRSTASGRIVAGVDGSDPAHIAAQWAAAQAHRRNVPLHLVHAVGTTRETLFTSDETIRLVRGAGERLLSVTRDRLTARFPDLEVTCELLSSGPQEALRELASPGETLVVGNRGQGGFGSLMLGSVGLGLVSDSPVPVVVVRGEPADGAGRPVVAAVRDEDDRPWAVLAAQEASLRGVGLRLLSVWGLVPQVGGVVSLLDGSGAAGRHRERIESLAETVRAELPGPAVEVAVETSASAGGALVEASREAVLLVMGNRRSGRTLGPSVGRTAHAVIHHAHCPVLVAPAPG